MNGEALELLDKEALIDLVLRLAARVAELEARLGLPPKTPDNSSTPPSQGKKCSADPTASGNKGRRASHPGTHRPLHPDPTRRRDVLVDQCRHCGSDVSRVAQTPFHAYDHIEIRRSSRTSRA